jgi:hypothetical protein
MRISYLKTTTTSLLALAWFAIPATAAQVTQIEWQITGGTFFNGSLSTVTSGAIVYTHHNVVGTATQSNITNGNWTITATGPSGSLSAVLNQPSLVMGYWTIYPVQNVLIGASTAPRWSSPTGHTNGYAIRDITFNLRSKIVGSSPFELMGRFQTDSGALNHFTHSFTLGSEVRTIVPEPGTASLLALGLLGLGCVAGGRATAIRALRRRRG